MYQPFPLQGPRKFTQIGIFGLQIWQPWYVGIVRMKTNTTLDGFILMLSQISRCFFNDQLAFVCCSCVVLQVFKASWHDNMIGSMPQHTLMVGSTIGDRTTQRRTTQHRML
jgi:hypothetical protein